MTKKPLSRAERSAAALRANLKRRKEGLAREGREDAPPPPPPAPEKDAPGG